MREKPKPKKKFKIHKQNDATTSRANDGTGM
jgi:hypothetical protein